MRTYGRANGKWVEVATDAGGFDDAVWVTTLVQCLLLNLGESPFYANYGIPSQQSVEQQVFPDYYVARTQQQFAPRFASLIVAKEQTQVKPVYRINIITHQGARIAATIPT